MIHLLFQIFHKLASKTEYLVLAVLLPYDYRPCTLSVHQNQIFIFKLFSGCYGKKFGPKGFGYGQGAGALTLTQ